MFAVSFTQAARTELIDAQDWYETESPGLGRYFRAAVDTAVNRIATNPLHFAVVHKSLRRALLARFPYMLFFVVSNSNHPGRRMFSREQKPSDLEVANLKQ